MRFWEAITSYSSFIFSYPEFFNQKRTTSPSPVLSSATAGSFDGKTVALGSSSPAKIPVKKRHADGSSSGPSLFGGQQHVVVAPAPPVLEPGMQAECASLFVMLNKELDQVRCMSLEPNLKLNQ